MARAVLRLSAIAIQKIKDPGLYPDGAGLYLRVSDTGTKSWVFRYKIRKRARSMGLGSLAVVSLAGAREKAQACRRSLLERVDPIQARTAQWSEQALQNARTITFDRCAATFVDAHRAGWKHPKHIEQWVYSLKKYASPAFGTLPVSEIDDGMVLRVLDPIWRVKPETANRVRRRIETILNYATKKGYRRGENPARWKGHLEWELPKRSSIRPVVHYASLPVAEIQTFMNELRARDGITPRALEFLILTATRTNETMGARWSEIDLKNATWTIPASRMKAKQEHRVPLSERALELLTTICAGGAGEYVFMGSREGKALSNMAFLTLLKRMKRPVTAHGFRSTFRIWAAESTAFPREVAEMALAHTIGSKVEAAYFRSDLFEKRRALMNEWSKFCLAGPISPAVILTFDLKRG